MLDIEPVEHNIQRQRKAELLDEAGNSKFLVVRADSRDQLGRFSLGVLQAQLNMIEAAVPELSQVFCVEQRPASDQVRIEVTLPGVADECWQDFADHRLAP